MLKVVFLPDLKSAEVQCGASVTDAAALAGVLIDASCNGVGTCGKCRVRVLFGDAGPVTEREKDMLTAEEIRAGIRLACQTSVQSDLEISVPSIHGGSTRKKKMVSLPEGFAPCNDIRRVTVKVPKAKMDYQVNDIDRIRNELDLPDMTLRRGVLEEIHPALDAQRGNVTLTLKEAELIGIEPGDTSGSCYGMAFDIGTTTVVGMLWNLSDGSLTDVETRTNYQSLYGADVISRISFSMQEDGNLELIHCKVIQCCNDITSEICERNNIDPAHIFAATVVGNTTMSHIFAGVTPKSMSRTPFAPVFCEAQELNAGTLGLMMNPVAEVRLLPNIAGHVGSDITGMVIATGIDHMNGTHVAIDIGTNGEVVAVRDGRLLCCSTAAGPAFEGATIKQGMRAAPGAIEKVTTEDGDISVKTIEDAAPVGICGSGLIDAIAVMLKTGVVEKGGRMRRKAEAIEAGVSEPIASRIKGEGMEACFVLTSSEGIDYAITQADVREVQLAKGAILAGIQTLMKELSIEEGNIDSVMLAGAFGNYIDINSALTIGLLPQVGPSRVIPVGNAAGTGSSMALLSDTERDHADIAARTIEHIELSNNPVFQDLYISAMTFDQNIDA